MVQVLYRTCKKIPQLLSSKDLLASENMLFIDDYGRRIFKNRQR